MEAVAPTIAAPRFGAIGRLAGAERQAAWLLGFAPIVYLALSGGGYDIIARSEVGILLWWILLLGVFVGALPRARFGRAAWLVALLLGAFLAWTWIAVGWSQSAERSLAETARVATYLGFFVLGATLVNRSTLRSLLNGLACSIALVSAVAVLSRLVPAWFPANPVAKIYMTSRLEYPFDYADAVGEFAALGLPLLLYIASAGRTLLGRALGAAALPIVVLCVGLTVSRGGVLAAAVGLLAFFLLVPDRLARLTSTIVAAAGSAVVMVALLHRGAVRDGFVSASAASQRHAVLTVLVLACVGTGLVQIGLAVAGRRLTRPRWTFVSRRASTVGAVLLAVGVIVAVIGLVASGADHRLWQQFQRPNAPTGSSNQYFRLFSISGSHRYQYWVAAQHAFDAHPWKGIGPGTFEFYWAQHNSLREFVRNGHSLYMETLAETGIVGLALVGGLVAFVLGFGSVRALRAAAPVRMLLATAVAGFAAFAAAASFDWVWQIGVLPAIGLLLAAAAVASLRSDRRRGPSAVATRLALAGAAIAAALAIATPLTETVAVRSSQAAVRSKDYRAALADAADAQRIEPDAATPRLQRALILEQTGDLRGAQQSITQAATREPTNWRIWMVASRIATETGHPRLALADYQRARALNPTSPIFRL
jgi:hypothetical protein